MSLDRIYILLESLFRPHNPQLELDAILCTAQSILRGHKFALALVPFLSIVLDDFPMTRRTKTPISGRILDCLVLAFCLGQANTLCDVSFRTFRKLMGVQDVPPSRYELLVTILY
jgi:hypothetical protein